MISYEISMGMSIIPVLLIVGDLNLSQIIAWQSAHGWMVMYAPLSFVIFMVASFAETNRTPFDLPEAETELVGGYHTEYSSMKFEMVFLAEYANMIMVGCVATLMFFGGAGSPFGNLFPNFGGPIVQAALPVFWFVAKVFAFLFLYIWVRGTVPRFRYDQLMRFGWKFLLPLAIANIVFTSLVYALHS
jgi:NADH-quinone oxidoreductase subunit H